MLLILMGAAMGSNPWVGESHSSLCCPHWPLTSHPYRHETGTLAVEPYLAPKRPSHVVGKRYGPVPRSPP